MSKRAEVDINWDAPISISFHQGTDDISRLIFLVVKHKIIVPQTLARFLPFGQEVAKLHNGIGSAGPVSELSPHYQLGQQLGEGSRAEAADIIARLIDSRIHTVDHRSKNELYGLIRTIEEDSQGLMGYSEADLSKAHDSTIPKFETGFTPLDEVTGGLYQGIFTLMAAPGTGKTSLFLSIMEALAKRGIPSWNFQNEIPATLIAGRISPIIRRSPEVADMCRLFCGPYSSQRVVEAVMANPDPERVVLFDSPDTISGGSGERRFQLEESYLELVRLKPFCKAIIIPSQPKAKDVANPSLSSPAESWAKVWYTDSLISAVQVAASQLMFKTHKNRFGPNHKQSVFTYNYVDLSYDMTSFWDDVQEEGEGTEGESEW